MYLKTKKEVKSDDNETKHTEKIFLSLKIYKIINLIMVSQISAKMFTD